MENPILNAINAVVGHINSLSQVPEEVKQAELELRASLEKLSKKELIEKLVLLQSKSKVKVAQSDLVAAILCDPACVVLSYEEISETILSNLNTDQKYSVNNLRWYKSQLQNVNGLPVLNRMPPKERTAIDRQLIMSLSNK